LKNKALVKNRIINFKEWDFPSDEIDENHETESTTISENV